MDTNDPTTDNDRIPTMAEFLQGLAMGELEDLVNQTRPKVMEQEEDED